MDIKEIVLMLNKIMEDHEFVNNETFYDLIEKIVELTNINTKFSRKDDYYYKEELCIKLARKVLSNLKQNDKKDFYDMINSTYLEYCNDSELIFEQIQIRDISISKVSGWKSQDEVKGFIINKGEINETPLKTSDIFRLIDSLDDDVKKKAKYK